MAKPQSNQRINKIKRVEKRKQHQEMFTQFGPTMTYSRGKIDLSNPLSMSSYKEIQNGLQEISFNKLTKNNPNFYPFSQSH